MKLGYSNIHKRYEAAFAEFKPLWKLDDPDWVAQRKQEWRDYAGSDGAHPNLKYAGRYYVFGEEPPSYIEGDGLYDRTIIKFGFDTRLACTPFETKEQVRRMWDLLVEISYMQATVDQYHSNACYSGASLAYFPNSAFKTKIITEALFCPELFIYEYKEKVVTISPRDFIINYSGVGFLYKKPEIEVDYRCFSFDYFMLCVKYCDEHNSLDTPRSQKALPKMYKSLLSYDDHSLNKYKLELKQRLIAAAEADDAPQILKRALEVARAES